MKIFVTGGAGFIGSHICEELYKKIPSSKLVILDKITYAANLKFISHLIKDKKRVKFIKADILDNTKYEKKIKNFDIAINLSAATLIAISKFFIFFLYFVLSIISALINSTLFLSLIK